MLNRLYMRDSICWFQHSIGFDAWSCGNWSCVIFDLWFLSGLYTVYFWCFVDWKNWRFNYYSAFFCLVRILAYLFIALDSWGWICSDVVGLVLFLCRVCFDHDSALLAFFCELELHLPLFLTRTARPRPLLPRVCCLFEILEPHAMCLIVFNCWSSLEYCWSLFGQYIAFVQFIACWFNLIIGVLRHWFRFGELCFQFLLIGIHLCTVQPLFV